MDDWKSILTRLIKTPHLHARFLNTLSLMEYMGARKIMKSQLEENINTQVLAHMTEEIRHAQIFKKMALKLSGGRLVTYEDSHLLAGRQGRDYIQSVDQSVAEILNHENSRKNYLLSTLIIEERANQIYPFYAQLMKPLGFGSQVSNVFQEEKNHLEQIRSQILQSGPLDSSRMEFLCKMEEEAFGVFMGEVKIQLDRSKTGTGACEFQKELYADPI